MAGATPLESSFRVKERVNRARSIQADRFKGNKGQETLCNARLSTRQLKAACSLDEESQKLLEMAMDKLGLSARAYTRVLKVARTIADLTGEENIRPSHVSEAIQYRSLDRTMI
jgi:magnesium chelatase family protein